MFNVEFLHVIREFEFGRIASLLPPRSRLLEIGGGTGYQALRLSQAGHDVTSIDVQSSVYNGKFEFPVEHYDGTHFPLEDKSVDVIFSSNVLEHVLDLDQLHRESRRVLRPGGFCLHVMPTGAWRGWTNLAHYIELLQRLAIASPALVPRGLDASARSRARSAAHNLLSTLKHYRVVPRHGERGNAFSEMITFSPSWWRRHFLASNYEIMEQTPLGLFYSGHMVLGARLPVEVRAPLSRVIGSACYAFKVRPRT